MQSLSPERAGAGAATCLGWPLVASPLLRHMTGLEHRLGVDKVPELFCLSEDAVTAGAYSKTGQLSLGHCSSEGEEVRTDNSASLRGAGVATSPSGNFPASACWWLTPHCTVQSQSFSSSVKILSQLLWSIQGIPPKTQKVTINVRN